MLAIVIYIITVFAVIAIGLVAVGRETFLAAHTLRPAVYDMNEAVQFVADRLDDRTASRLTPDDVRAILTFDADLIEAEEKPECALRHVVEDEAAVDAVMGRLNPEQLAVIDRDDVVAVIAGRSLYLEAIGAIGTLTSQEEMDESGADDPVQRATTVRTEVHE